MNDWKDIPGYEGLYQASTDGQIRTCPGKTTSNARYKTRVWKQRVMKPTYQKRKTGHGADAKVKLWKDRSVKTHLVSRLVAMTWCRGYDKGLTVNHIDGNPLNNHSENLEWVSRKENIRLAYKDGLYSQAKPISISTGDGSQKRFASLAAASRHIGHSSGYLSNKVIKEARR